jgi:DNA-binding beta-propeller fold protein YncE
MHEDRIGWRNVARRRKASHQAVAPTCASIVETGWRGLCRLFLALLIVFPGLLVPDPAGATDHDICVGDGTTPPAPTITPLRGYWPGLHAPARLAIDAEGNVYATDPDRGQIVVRRPDGRVRARLGDVGHPVAIAVDDGAGRPLRIYVGDDRSGRVTAYKSDWQPDGVLGQGAGEFAGVTDIAVDPGIGNLYVADAKAHLVKVYSRAGALLFTFGGRGSEPGQFDHPAALVVDGDRAEVLVVDQLNFRIQSFDLDGIFICRIGDLAGSDPGFGSLFSVNPRHFTVPQGIWVDSLGLIYVADSAQGWIRALDRAGNIVAQIGSFGRGPGELMVPLDVVTDGHGRLFVAAAGNGRLEVFGLDDFVDPERFAPAEVDLRPNPFDHQSAVPGFTAIIEVPGYRPDDIALDSVTANGVPADSVSAEIGDRDGDNVPELRVTFARDALAATLPADGEAVVTLRGMLTDLDFDGAAVIAVTGGIVDADGDGVLDDVDACLDTAPGAAVDPNGCSIAQLCPCEGPVAGQSWANHGHYVACTAHTARRFADAGLIGRAEIGGIVKAAAVWACGQGSR